MRIAIVGPAHPYKGGAAQHTTALAHQLAAVHETVLKSWRAQYPKLLYPGQLTIGTPEVELFPGTERPLAWYRPDSWWLTGHRLGRQGFYVVVLSIVSPVQVPAYLTLARAAQAGGCTVIERTCGRMLRCRYAAVTDVSTGPLPRPVKTARHWR